MEEQRYFHGVKACVFDAYGTLFDLPSATHQLMTNPGDTTKLTATTETGAVASPTSLATYPDKAERLGQIWRQKQLEYSWLRSLTGHYTSFWQVTAEALDYALITCEIDDPALRDALLDSYHHLIAYPDVAPVLDRLKTAGLSTAILSNGSAAMLDTVVANAKLIAWLDTVISAETARVFKPDYRVYQLACDALGLEAHSICFLSSNGWDAA
ncbi:MAG: haloacid dehalogenase type II, partial [Pseudomonadota bacterium]